MFHGIYFPRLWRKGGTSRGKREVGPTLHLRGFCTLKELHSNEGKGVNSGLWRPRVETTICGADSYICLQPPWSRVPI